MKPTQLHTGFIARPTDGAALGDNAICVEGAQSMRIPSLTDHMAC